MTYPKPVAEAMDRCRLHSPEAVAWAGILVLHRLLTKGSVGQRDLQEVITEARLMDILVRGSCTEPLEGGGNKT